MSERIPTHPTIPLRFKKEMRLVIRNRHPIHNNNDSKTTHIIKPKPKKNKSTCTPVFKKTARIWRDVLCLLSLIYRLISPSPCF